MSVGQSHQSAPLFISFCSLSSTPSCFVFIFLPLSSHCIFSFPLTIGPPRLYTGSATARPAPVAASHLSLTHAKLCAVSHPQRGTVVSPLQREVILPTGLPFSVLLRPLSDDPSVTHLQLIFFVHTAATAWAYGNWVSSVCVCVCVFRPAALVFARWVSRCGHSLVNRYWVSDASFAAFLSLWRANINLKLKWPAQQYIQAIYDTCFDLCLSQWRYQVLTMLYLCSLRQGFSKS